MSQDEIVFGDIAYREPQKLRRPDRDRRFACVAYEVPAPKDLPIFLDRATADAIERHALRDTSVELGGILLGKECLDEQTGEPFVWVTNCLEAKHYENTQASFTYTHDSWEEITRQRDQHHPDLDIVGWYHTHPDFGIFLSGHDLFIQQHFFGQPLQVAYVVDPIRQTRGFFQWRDREMHQVGGFYLTAGRSDRVALARLANDLENLHNAAETGGGGFSPRLEAELLSMLTRPSVHHAPPAADRTLTAVLFTMLGSMLGVVGLAALLWLGQLNNRIGEQTHALESLQKNLEDSADRERMALDAAVGKVEGSEPNRFVARYTRAVRELDQAKRQYESQLAANELLGTRTKEQDKQLSELNTQLDDARKLVKTFEAGAKESSKLREELLALQTDYAKQRQRLDEYVELNDTPENQRALVLLRRYNTTWYVAAGGWALSVILGLGLVAAYTMLSTPTTEGQGDTLADPTPPPPDPSGPTHRIV